uniref:adipocyte plasma membrane-associated protein-like n=1 Tax=Styela clava TaxID=7725 RepID=UPI00193A8646|nr:adipocyte plasma membrane-associated protein-like [Styela clava]
MAKSRSGNVHRRGPSKSGSSAKKITEESESPSRSKSSPQKIKKESESHKVSTLCQKLAFALALLVVTFAICLTFAHVNSPIAAVSVNDIHDVRQLKWTNVENNNLAHGRKLLNELPGPESIVADEEGNWYTGLIDGRVVKIINAGKEEQVVVDITASYDFAIGSKRKGKRPLGIRLSKSTLYFVDGYQGLFSIDIKTNQWKKIVGYDEVEPHMMFPDDLTISSNGKTIYFTDVSEKWDYDNVTFSIIEGECSGRIFKCDVQSKRIDLIYSGLCFPNGIELDRSENNLLVSENARRRVIVIDLESRNIVKTIKLPGGPDNIRRARNNGYWVAIPTLHHPTTDFIWAYPALRNIIASILGREGLFQLVDLNQGIIVKLTETFEPESIHYDVDGKVSKAITEASELDNGEILLGSFIQSGIVLLDGKSL